MLKRAYVEITNRCNLRCAFCPGTSRTERTMTVEEFAHIARKLRPHVRYIYLHIMGEPLLHPQLAEILRIAAEQELLVCITTNGTLLSARGAILLATPPHKVSISLHSFEGNATEAERERQYCEAAWDFCTQAAARGTICALRLWNEGGHSARNHAILSLLREKTGADEWENTRNGSYRLRERIYLERDVTFDWPDMDAPLRETQFCYALRDQIGILCDGTVVPCCLDRNGEIALGNIFTDSLGDILQSVRAVSMREGFSNRRPAEELCRRCGYATRFNL